jgi:hypothetical protein
MCEKVLSIFFKKSNKKIDDDDDYKGCDDYELPIIKIG